MRYIEKSKPVAGVAFDADGFTRRMHYYGRQAIQAFAQLHDAGAGTAAAIRKLQATLTDALRARRERSHYWKRYCRRGHAMQGRPHRRRYNR